MPVLSYEPFFIGIRYLLKKRLSYLGIAGVMLGVGTLIVVMSVMTGFANQIRAVIRGYLSDITIQRFAFKLYGFEDWEEVMEKVRNVEHVVAAAPFINSAGLIRFKSPDGTPASMKINHMEHVFIRAVDPDLEKGVSELREYMRSGELDDLEEDSPQPNEGKVDSCFIGEAMFGFRRDFFPRASETVVLFTISDDINYRLSPFAVNGVFKTGNYEYDRNTVVISLDDAMRFLQSRGAVSGLSVKLDDYRNAPKVVKRLEEAFGPQYSVVTWEQQQKVFLEAVEMERRLMALILSFVGLLACFCIFAILTMTVQEKRRDIGILKAIGFTRAKIAAIFVIDGLTIGVSGAVLGVVGGLFFCARINEIADLVERTTGFSPFPKQIYYFDRIPTDRGLLIPLIIAAGAIVCCFLFSLIPALRAARLDPIETLRYE